LLNFIKTKLLGFALLFSLLLVVSYADENLVVASIVGFALVLIFLYFKFKNIRESLTNLNGAVLSKQGSTSIAWGIVFFVIPTYYIYDDYMFAFNSVSEKVVVIKSTDLICSYGRRSSKSESPCWDIEYILEGKTIQRRVHHATKKGDSFNVNYLKNNFEERRYEDPIVDRVEYFKKGFSIFQIISYFLFFYNISLGIFLIKISKKATGLVVPAIGSGAKNPPNTSNERVEPSFKID
jgi:hypothetical protein